MTTPDNDTLVRYLSAAVEAKASDLFLVAGAKPYMKKDKRLVPLSDDILRPDDAEALILAIYGDAKRDLSNYDGGDDDFSLSVPGLARFRVNTYRQRGSMGAVVRVVAFGIPDWESLGIPGRVMDLADLQDGLVLFTGSAGSGKSTTQACIIDRINRTRDVHVVTLEDPIEFLHRNDMAIISQRELGIDTADAASGLRACLRQAPDVIQLGEMRDHETIATAMTAAETGHLVMATLHTKGAANTIDRIVDAFPAGQQGQVRAQLAMVLRTVVSQQLLPDVDGGLVPAFEIMDVNMAVRTIIREGRTQTLDGVISGARHEGMCTMEQSVAELARTGRISRDVAMLHAEDPARMAAMLV